ncbi:MAG: JDVT-CTERM system CAAX-type protease [Halomonadaceae bacterium]|nr:MAG: JDVT-CTERM system CAAX-type protease [Halomonadaceae bacterium]
MLRDSAYVTVLIISPVLALLWLFWLQPSPDALAVTAAGVVFFVVIFPVLEELVFRGLIQGSLLRTQWGQKRFVSLSLANLLTTLCFALLHGPRGGITLALAVILPSLALGVFRERHRSVLSPVLLHMVFNGSVMAVFLVYRSA